MQPLDGWIPASLSGVQSFGVLKPVREYGDGEDESREALTKKKVSLTTSVVEGNGDHEMKTEEVELEMCVVAASVDVEGHSRIYECNVRSTDYAKKLVVL